MINKGVMKKIVLMAGLLIMAFMLAPVQSDARPIKVGIIDCYSGPAAIFCKDCLKGFQMALEEINKKGVLGTKIEFTTRDTKFKVDIGLSVAKELVMRENVDLLVGTMSSGVAMAASDYANIVSLCFTSDKADNKELTIFGPEPMPIPEAMRRLLAIVHPDCKIEHLPVWLARISAWMMFDKNLKMAVRLMAFFDKYDDSEVVAGPEEADSIFGRPSMTVEQWSIIYRKAIKGI